MEPFPLRTLCRGAFFSNKGRDGRVGLGPFTPASTSVQSDSERYFVALRDQIVFGSSVFDIGIAYDTGNQNDTPHGSSTYIVTPSTTLGNYFQTTLQRSRRSQIIGNLNREGVHGFGEHSLSAGWNVSGLDLAQNSTRSQIEYLRADGTLLDRATFFGSGALHMADTQLGGYVQDLWRPFQPILLAGGLRVDWDRLINRALIAPRLALNWLPDVNGNMKFTLAWGMHYQPLNLFILSQGFGSAAERSFFRHHRQCWDGPAARGVRGSAEQARATANLQHHGGVGLQNIQEDLYGHGVSLSPRAKRFCVPVDRRAGDFYPAKQPGRSLRLGRSVDPALIQRQSRSTD